MCFGSGARFSGHVAAHFFQSEFSLQKTVCAGEPSTKTWSTKHGLALSFSKILWETLMDVIGNLFWFQPQTSSRKMNKQFAVTFTTKSLLEDVDHFFFFFLLFFFFWFLFFFLLLLLKNWHVLELLTVDIDLAGPESRSSDESAWLRYVPLNTHTKRLYLRNIFQNIPQCPEDIKRHVRYHRRKFRSQTSNNMDRWKAEQGRGREKRKLRREKSRRERVRKKKMQMREKVGKCETLCFSNDLGLRGVEK